MYRNLLCFCTLTMKYQKEKVKKQQQQKNLFKIMPERKKKTQNLGINLTKEVKDLYVESYKSLIKEIEDDSKTWKDIPCS